MRNLEARLEHWSTGWRTLNQGDSLPTPFYMYTDYFDGRDVLEMGPGEGRQYDTVKHLTKTYSIVDISAEGLASPSFDAVDHKYLIKSYMDKLHRKFDLIHFWYVLHHVPSDELHDLAAYFLPNHLNKDGIVMFNTPYLDHPDGAYADDGVLTTRHRLPDVLKAFDPYFFCIILDGAMCESSNGHVYIGRKR